MNPLSLFALLASESDIARGFSRVILHADGIETREVFTPEQALAALGGPPRATRSDAVLLIDANLLGREGPRGDVWGQLVRNRPELPVVGLQLDAADQAPAAFAERVQAHVDPMAPRALVDAVRRAGQARPDAVRPGSAAYPLPT